MLKYKSINKLTNEWKTSLNTLNSDNASINNVVMKFTDQLKKDYINLKNNERVSDCAYNAPRMGGSLDKKYKISHYIAYDLFPVDETKIFEVEKVKSYISYQKILSKLSRAFIEQLEKEETLNEQFKEVRKTYQRKYFCELKNKPINDKIINPTPMPVEVASIEELNPFFEHLANNIKVEDPELEFTRGVQYNDGRMDLCKQVVGDLHIRKLMESLKNNTQVTHFLLGNNIIGINGAKAIAEFLNDGYGTQIKTWYLAGNHIDSDGINWIAFSLRNNTVCEALWLKRNPIKSEGAKRLGEMLEINKTIKILDLHNTGILDEGAKYIMESLKKNTTLKHLYLDANGITAEGAKYIADYFNYMVENDVKGITSLWMDINRVDDDGIIFIANSLKNYKYLKRLVIGSNRLSDVGAKAICDALVNSASLKVFDLGLYKSTADLQELPNNIGDMGVNYIVDFIKNNKSVEVLSVLHNNISSEGIDKLADAMLTNDTICWVYYAQYSIEIKQNTQITIKNKMTQNIFKHYNMTVDEFCNNKLRYIKGSKKLKNIDSVYRNRM